VLHSKRGRGDADKQPIANVQADQTNGPGALNARF
jgi:hypothetical protein